MRYLLDTHAFLRLIASDPNLGKTVEQAITDPANEIFVSIATP